MLNKYDFYGLDARMISVSQSVLISGIEIPIRDNAIDLTNIEQLEKLQSQKIANRNRVKKHRENKKSSMVEIEKFIRSRIKGEKLYEIKHNPITDRTMLEQSKTVSKRRISYGFDMSKIDTTMYHYINGLWVLFPIEVSLKDMDKNTIKLRHDKAERTQELLSLKHAPKRNKPQYRALTDNELKDIEQLKNTQHKAFMSKVDKFHVYEKKVIDNATVCDYRLFQ